MKTNRRHWVAVALVQLMALSFAGSLHAQSQQPITLWKKKGIQAQLAVNSAERVHPGVLVVGYRLLLLNTDLVTPELFVMSLSAVCDPQSNKPVKVFNSANTLLKLVGGKFVEDKVEHYSPPKDVPFGGDNDYGELPASAACVHGIEVVTR